MSRPLQGLVIPHPEIVASAISAAESSYTEQGPRPGILVPGARTSAVLEPSGTAESGEAIEVQTLIGGYPATDATGATFAWRKVATDEWHGWDTPRVFHGWDWVNRVADGGTQEATDPYVLALASGRVLMAYHLHNTASSTHSVLVRTKDDGTGWSNAITASSGTDIAAESRPALLQLPSGRILCYHWVTAGSAQQAIRVVASDDDGATWTTLGARASATVPLDAATGYTCGRLRSAYSAGQVVLFADLVWNNTGAHVLGQWASDSLGYALALVEIGAVALNTTRLRTPVVFGVPDGGFYLVAYNLIDDQWVSRALTSAVEPHGSVTANTIDGDFVTLGPAIASFAPYIADANELAGWIGADGTWWLAVVDSTSSYGIFGAYSRDNGASWYNAMGGGRGQMAGTPDQVYVGIFDPAIKFRALTATDNRGTVVWGTQITTSTDTHDDDSLLALYSGGSTSLPYPAPGFRDQWQLDAGTTWIAVEAPDVLAWTASGAGTAALSVSGLDLTTTANAKSYSLALDTTNQNITDVMIVETELTVTSGGSLASDAISLQVAHADGTDDYLVSVHFTTTGYRVVDANGAVTVADVVADCTTGIAVRVYLTAGKVSVYHRIGAATTQSSIYPEWSFGAGSSILVSNTATPGAGDRIAWGHIANGTAASTWKALSYTVVNDTALLGAFVYPPSTNPEDGGVGTVFPPWGTELTPLLGAAFASPSTLLGRRFSADRSVLTGTAIRLRDGPTAGGDSWTSVARADYPISRIHPVASPSPSVRWRSIDDGSAQRFTWQLPEDTNAAPLAENKGLALIILGANWKTATLARWDGAYTDIASVDLSHGLQGIPFERDGDRVIVDVGGSDVSVPAWITRGELAGCTINLGGGVRRRILRNTSGRWKTTGAIRPMLVLDGVDPADPTSGTADIWRTSTVVFIPGDWAGSRIRLTIDAIATVDGYLEAGICVTGSFIPLQPPTWGRSIDATPQVEVVDLPGGLRTSRVLTPSGRRSTRRALSISWPEGTMTRPLYEPALEPALLSAGTADPTATQYATPEILAGLLEELAGARTPVVYVSSIASSDTTTVRYANPGPDLMIYGRITSALTRSAAMGTEGEDEVWRISELTIEEEL